MTIRTPKMSLCFVALALLSAFTSKAAAQTEPPTPAVTAALSVADFLPAGFKRDGSVSYQADVQRAIDAAGREGKTLVFPPMIYRADETGWQVPSRVTLSMYGAVFQLDEHCTKDGQVFAGQNVSHVQFLGGEIAGRNDVWSEGVNIRGIYLTGECRSIRIRDMEMRDLTSNGIGIFGDADKPARDLWVTDTVIENCCNKYGDYQTEKQGPEKGSVRQDQGLVAFYYVNDFVVRGCRFEKSRSDGTHFFKCQQGQFVQNKVYAAQMGGYFLETCADVLATDNVIRDNGSRGVTIERGSRNCTLKGNIVANSGREGLWAPDSAALVIMGNVFDRNGRKPNGPLARHVWNANITVNGDPFDPTKSPVEDYLISDNILYTTEGQIAAIRIDTADAKGIMVQNNILRDVNRNILVQGDTPQNVIVRNND